MWDDVVIGDGNKGASAIKVFSVPGMENVSENQVSFWISRVYLDCGMTIMKNTPEGGILTRFIEEKAPHQAIQNWLELTFLRNANATALRKMINHALEKSFCEGKHAKAGEIREALYL